MKGVKSDHPGRRARRLPNMRVGLSPRRFESGIVICMQRPQKGQVGVAPGPQLFLSRIVFDVPSEPQRWEPAPTMIERHECAALAEISAGPE